MGRLRAPTLRNIELTAPYTHDGSIATLAEVIEHYARGGRLVPDGPFAGDGRDSPRKSDLIRGFDLEDRTRARPGPNRNLPPWGEPRADALVLTAVRSAPYPER